MNIYIETERLCIRELLPEDEAGMYEMDTDPEVHQYLGKNPLTTMEAVRDVIQFVRQQYIDNGIGRWAVIDKGTNEFLGWTGFKLMRETANGHTNHYDFGYRLKRSAWGKGIATEAGQAALQYGLETLKLTPVYAMTDVNNAASRHVLEKLGFRFKELFKYDGPLSIGSADDIMATWYELPDKSNI